MKVSVLLILILLTFGNAFSQEKFEDYEFLSKAQTVVIENAQLINFDFQNKLIQVFTEKPELLTDEDPTKLIEAIEELTSQGLPNKVKLKFSDEVKKPIINIGHEVRTIFRKYGAASGIAYAALSISGYVVPVILVAVGQPHLAAIIGVLPMSTVFLVSLVAVTKVTNHYKMVKLYGGKDEYQYYKKLHKQVNETLRLKGKKSLIVPMEKTSEDEYKAVILNSSNTLDKFLSLVDHKRSKLDVLQLKYFLEENQAWDETLEKIKATSASDGLKVASMLYHLQVANPALYAEVQLAFPKSFLSIPAFEFSQALKNWVLAAAHAETKEELFESVQLIPIGSRTLDVAKIWTKCLAPRLIEDTKGLPYSSYRSLSKSLMALEVTAELTPAKLIDENWRAEFQSHLQSTLSR